MLTPRGQSLFPLVLALRQWGETHLFAPDEAHSQLLDRRTGQPVLTMRVLDAQGAELLPEQSQVRKLERTGE